MCRTKNVILASFSFYKMSLLMSYISTGVLDDTLNLVKTLAEVSRSVVNVGFSVTVAFFVSR